MSERRNNYLKRYEPFERHAQRYDGWFDSDRGKYVFPVEVECLKGVLGELRRPCLEVGVGTGRFAEALGIEYGIDPSPNVLLYAKERGISVVRGFAEDLPYTDHSFHAIFMIVTVCFLTDP